MLNRQNERNNSRPLMQTQADISSQLFMGFKYVICTAGIISVIPAVFYFASALQLLMLGLAAVWLLVTVGILNRLLPDLSPIRDLSSLGLGAFRKVKRIAVSIGLVSP